MTESIHNRVYTQYGLYKIDFIYIRIYCMENICYYLELSQMCYLEIYYI